MIKTAMLCLALTVYYEARGEPIEGQYAVAEVVINRSEERNLSICEVVYEKNQFSWVKQQHSKKIPQNKTFEMSKLIAKDALDNREKYNYSKQAQHFKHKKLRNRNSNYLTIGNHVFYK